MSISDLRKELTQFKKTSGFSWLNTPSADGGREALRDLGDAYKKFLKNKVAILNSRRRESVKPLSITIHEN